MEQVQNSCDGSSLVLLVGAPRSGTTWLQKLIASHPRVHTGQESEVFLYIGALWQTWRRQLDPDRSGRGGIGLACYLTQEQFYEITKEFADKLLLNLLRDLPEGHIFLEKTPHHTAVLDEAFFIYPKLKVIHLLRDGRDVSASLVAASKGWGKNWAPKNVRAAGRMWRKAVRDVRLSYIATIADQFIELKYEDLVKDTAKELRKLGDFLGLEWTPEEIADSIQKNTLENLKAGKGTQLQRTGEFVRLGLDQVIQEPKGFVREGKAGSWRGEFTFIQKIQLYLILGEELAVHGYTWEMPYKMTHLLRVLLRLYKGTSKWALQLKQ